MQKVKVMVTSKRRVEKGGVALILKTTEHLEITGREGADVLQEALVLQPDLLVYELGQDIDDDYEVLIKLKEYCSWTKIIIFSSGPVEKESLKKFLNICSGYLQGPVLPGFFLKAVELACYSGYFFFLGSSKDIKPGLKDEVHASFLSKYSNTH